MGRLPPQSFGGTVPPVPLGLRPWVFVFQHDGRIEHTTPSLSWSQRC